MFKAWHSNSQGDRPNPTGITPMERSLEKCTSQSFHGLYLPTRKHQKSVPKSHKCLAPSYRPQFLAVWSLLLTRIVVVF